MAEPTVKQQLADALERLLRTKSTHSEPACPADGPCACCQARTAIDRYRAELEDDAHTVPCEKCRKTGVRHVAGEPTQEPCGECSGEGVVCKPGKTCESAGYLLPCDTSCSCYQAGANEGHSSGCNDDSCACWAAGHDAGLEAQRERVGGGKA